MSLMKELFVLYGIFDFVLHSVISSLRLDIFLLHYLTLLLITASSALLMILDSRKLLLFNFFLQPLRMLFMRSPSDSIVLVSPDNCSPASNSSASVITACYSK